MWSGEIELGTVRVGIGSSAMAGEEIVVSSVSLPSTKVSTASTEEPTNLEIFLLLEIVFSSS